MTTEFRIQVPNVSAAEQSRLASSLQDALAPIGGITKTAIVRERPEAQDAGTILSIALSAPAIVLMVRAIGQWLIRSNQSSVTFTRPDGSVIIKNMKSQDVPKAIEAIAAELKAD